MIENKVAPFLSGHLADKKMQQKNTRTKHS